MDKSQSIQRAILAIQRQLLDKSLSTPKRNQLQKELIDLQKQLFPKEKFNTLIYPDKIYSKSNILTSGESVYPEIKLTIGDNIDKGCEDAKKLSEIQKQIREDEAYAQKLSCEI